MPPLLRHASSDEYVPVPWSVRDTRALERAGARSSRHARGVVGMTRRRVPVRPSRHRRDVARDRRRARRRVLRRARGRGVRSRGRGVRVRGHARPSSTCRRISSTRSAGRVRTRPRSRAFSRWSTRSAGPSGVDPHTDRRRRVGRASCSARARPRSRCSRRRPVPRDSNVLTNRQIAAARDVVDRYADSGRVLTHTIVHPNLGASELDAMSEWSETCRPSGWKCYTLWGPPTAASPTGGWFLDDEEVGFPFLERVRALGPRVVATHKGLGGPIPDASVAAASPRDIGPAAAAFTDIDFVVYHSGYERDPDGQEGPYDAERRSTHARRRPPRRDARRARDRAGRERLRGARHHVVPDAAPAARSRARARQAARRARARSGCSGAPTRSGTDHRSRSSTRSARSQIPESMQEEFGYPPLDADAKERILSLNARARVRHRRRDRRRASRPSATRAGSRTRRPRCGDCARSVERRVEADVPRPQQRDERRDDDPRRNADAIEAQAGEQRDREHARRAMPAGLKRSDSSR